MFYRLSDNLALRAHWRPYRAKPTERVLVVKSGKAFPPSHPTTRLCLDLLREVLARQRVAFMADIGCGTGILSLAAAALGVPRVIGVDILMTAARASRNNADANRLGQAVRVVRGSTECLKGPFDLVAANLPWEVQLDKIAELDRLAAGGRLIISGFRDNQEDELRESYQRLGWRLVRRLVKDFWHPELPPDISFTWVAWLLERKSHA
ncbi:MAG: 50S ribosomal protein L11 methyltransferase [Deltaproteobacteria bacterium]|nr:50S ribosomal protein L11 methyltransferase [Deltaproteobacteria bacterium]